MPPLIVWALGAVGAVAVGRWIGERVRRRDAELRSREKATSVEREQGPRLERDPVTGIYRPK